MKIAQLEGQITVTHAKLVTSCHRTNSNAQIVTLTQARLFAKNAQTKAIATLVQSDTEMNLECVKNVTSKLARNAMQNQVTAKSARKDSIWIAMVLALHAQLLARLVRGQTHASSVTLVCT